jgi:nicotinamidase/pyrazinamidase
MSDIDRVRSPGGRWALLVVDVQRDFCPGGALPVPAGDRILPAINRYVAQARELGMPIYASRDWHPAVTRHFKPYGGEWPPHCVQGTDGAAFHRDLDLPRQAIVVSKGEDPDRPGYSAFEGSTPSGQSFGTELRSRNIDGLYVAGLATDYCVRQTTLDALRAGLRTIVLTDAIAGIDARPGDVDRALVEMSGAGAGLTTGLISSETARTPQTATASDVPRAPSRDPESTSR